MHRRGQLCAEVHPATGDATPDLAGGDGRARGLGASFFRAAKAENEQASLSRGARPPGGRFAARVVTARGTRVSLETQPAGWAAVTRLFRNGPQNREKVI